MAQIQKSVAFGPHKNPDVGLHTYMYMQLQLQNIHVHVVFIKNVHTANFASCDIFVTQKQYKK